MGAEFFDEAKVRAAVRLLIEGMGEDPDREGLADTPRRVAGLYRELMLHDQGRVDTMFEHGGTDQMVVVSGMRLWSLCEHHLLPFWCDLSVGYIAEGRVLGLSKFARIAQGCAHRLQLQERLVEQVADGVQAVTGVESVAVFARGEHLCMTMRGVRTPAIMSSSVMRGNFREPAVRAEFLSIVGMP